MANNTIITIGRQYGSGGRDLGAKLAEKLNCDFYDKEIIQLAAGSTGYTPEYISKREENMTNSFLYDLVHEMYAYSDEYEPPKDKIFEAEAEVIRSAAKKGNCVIVGRCADYVLKDNPNVVSVFVHADEKFCLDRAMERNSMTEKEMKKYIEKTDKFRGDFYRYHTGHEWADARIYDLCLNSGKLGFQKCVEEIKAYIKIRFDL